VCRQQNSVFTDLSKVLLSAALTLRPRRPNFRTLPARLAQLSVSPETGVREVARFPILRWRFGSLGEILLPTPNAGGAEKPSCSELKGVQVLVVEDNWHVANSLKLFLETNGMEVSGPAATTTDARRLAAAQNPDLAVVDLNLKGEMAYALIDQLHDQGVPIVVISGYAVLRSLTDKVVVVLQKPFNPTELLAAIHRALAHDLESRADRTLC
jgi:CheY-like chemotaxis protein